MRKLEVSAWGGLSSLVKNPEQKRRLLLKGKIMSFELSFLFLVICVAERVVANKDLEA